MAPSLSSSSRPELPGGTLSPRFSAIWGMSQPRNPVMFEGLLLQANSTRRRARLHALSLLSHSKATGLSLSLNPLMTPNTDLNQRHDAGNWPRQRSLSRRPRRRMHARSPVNGIERGHASALQRGFRNRSAGPADQNAEDPELADDDDGHRCQHEDLVLAVVHGCFSP